MFRQLVDVGTLFSDTETPGLVTQWIVDGECGFSDRCRDLDCGILEGESSQ